MIGDAQSWSGRHVLVTGAANGIGRAIAARFSELGAIVTGVDLDNGALAELRASGVIANSLVHDMACADAGAVVGEAWAVAPVDVLVNAAGIYPAVPVTSVTAAIWDRMMNVNARAPMLTTIALSELARGAGSHPNVVNISSGAALRSRPGGGVYATTKAALNMVTRATALELGPIGIRVNAVSPGFVEVASDANPISDAYRQAISQTPVGRAGRPEDIVRAVLWLADSSAEWVTGTILSVDGGSSAGAMNLPLHWDGLSATQSPAAEVNQQHNRQEKQ